MEDSQSLSGSAAELDGASDHMWASPACSSTTVAVTLMYESHSSFSLQHFFIKPCISQS